MPNNKVREGKLPDSSSDNLSERLVKAGRWGFLPEKVREEMVSSTGKEAPVEYRRIINRYYQRLSDFYKKR